MIVKDGVIGLCDIVNVIVNTYVMCNLFVLSNAVHVVLEYSYHCSFAICVM